MLSQQTLRKPVRVSGTGLHSGNRVNLTLLPAPANSGILFRRTDLEGKPEIEALVENVADTQRSTTLAKGNVRIHTVEHVLAALSGVGINNAIIELDASEPPIGDGSSAAVNDAIEEDFSTADGHKAYIAGPPIMVESVVQTLKNLGIQSEDCHADAFYTESEKKNMELK